MYNTCMKILNLKYKNNLWFALLALSGWIIPPCFLYILFYISRKVIGDMFSFFLIFSFANMFPLLILVIMFFVSLSLIAWLFEKIYKCELIPKVISNSRSWSFFLLLGLFFNSLFIILIFIIILLIIISMVVNFFI